MKNNEVKEIAAAVRRTDRLLERRIRGLTVRVERNKKLSPEIVNELKYLLQFASPHHVRRPASIWRSGLRVGNAFSLHAELLRVRIHSHETHAFPPHWKLDDKGSGHAFVDMLEGIRRPLTVTAGEPISRLQIEPGLVIKPEQGAGARGCYVPVGPGGWRHVKSGEVVCGVDALRQHAAELTDPKKNRTALIDRWKTEEFITEATSPLVPARDVKFYCFYGEIGLAFEIQRHPERAFYNLGSVASPSTSRYEHPFRGDYDYFQGKGVTEADIESVRTISSQIPAPFISIDMLRSENGLVFSEFTPHPIATRDLAPSLDRRLGHMWHSAQQRLTRDLIAGVRFKKFEAITARQI